MACHAVLFSELEIVIDLADGSVKQPLAMLCPDQLVPWDQLPILQKAIYAHLDEAFQSGEELYESIAFLESLGDRIAAHNVSSQDDLAHFQRLTLEEPLRYIFYQLKNMPSISAAYDVGDGIILEHHCDFTQAETDLPQNPKPFASDQVCVRRLDQGDPDEAIAYVIGCKTPAKLTMEQLRLVLRGTMGVSQIANRPTPPPPDDEQESYRFHAERLTVAALVQTFDSMIDNGLEYGVLTTGELFVFLWIDWADVTTLHYHVAEPGWEVDHCQVGDEIYYTAISQLLAFTLLALGPPNQNRTHSQNERDAAKAQLQAWTVDWETAWREMPESNKRGPPLMQIPFPRTYDRTPPVPPPPPPMEAPAGPPGVQFQPMPMQAPAGFPSVQPQPLQVQVPPGMPYIHLVPSRPAYPQPQPAESPYPQPRPRKRPAESDGSNGASSSEAQMSSTPSRQDNGEGSSSSPPALKKSRPCPQAPPSENHPASTPQAPPCQNTRAPGSQPPPAQNHYVSHPQAPVPQQPPVLHMQPHPSQQSFVFNAQFPPSQQPWILVPQAYASQQPPVSNNPQLQYLQGPYSRITVFNGPSSQMQMPMQTPSPPHSQQHTRRTTGKPQFCTQACLRGLTKGGPLDTSCPNAQLHQRNGAKTHAITLAKWQTLIYDQLKGDVDDGMVPISNQHGRGVTFQLTLKEYGYTLVAKGVHPGLVCDLESEVDVEVGSCVPMYLGSIDLTGMDKKFYYTSKNSLVSLILLSWSGDLPGQPVASRGVQQPQVPHAAGVAQADVP